MKKNTLIICIVAAVLVVGLVIGLVLVLGGDKTPTPSTPETPETPAEKTYYLATATISKELASRGGSKIANNFAVVVFDADGKIVAARFDSIEAAHPTLADGVIVVDEASLKSKVESEYKKGSMSDTWGNQIAKFEAFIVGKTAAEVAELALTDADGKNAGLVTGCTMVSTSYSSMLDCQALVAKAAASDKKVEFKVAEDATIKLGLGVDANAGFNSNGKDIDFTANCAGTVFVGDKAVAGIVDSTVQTYKVENGDAANPTTYKESKLVIGVDYNMVAYGGACAEWYVQAQNYANTVVGKTVAEIADLSTDKIEGKCTMYVGGYKAVLVEAAQNAK